MIVQSLMLPIPIIFKSHRNFPRVFELRERRFFWHQFIIMNRNELQESYIQWDLSEMSNEQLRQFFIDTQNRELGDLDDDELVEDVRQYAPHLLE